MTSMVEKERKYRHLRTMKNQNLNENGNGNVVKGCLNNKKKETMEETNGNGNEITASKTSPHHGI